MINFSLKESCDPQEPRKKKYISETEIYIETRLTELKEVCLGGLQTIYGFPQLSCKEFACNTGASDSWVGKIPWRRDRLPTPVFLGFPGGSAPKESAYNTGDLGSIPGLERSPGEGIGYPLHYSGLENPMDCV